MNRIDYARDINWKGTASRIIAVNELPNYKIGEKINAGLSWTDGGEFTVETKGDYQILFVIKQDVEGHKVDYDNGIECNDIGATDCEYEKEILINKELEIVEIYNYDEEVGYMEVHLK